MKFLLKNLFPSRGELGLSFHSDGVALAWRDKGPGSPSVLRHMQFLAFQDPQEGIHLFKETVRRENLGGKRCVAVLDVGDYQFLQVTPPQVPESEMRSALLWQVRDLISYPVEETVLDFFPLPQQGSRSRSPVAYAVAAHKETLTQRIAFLQEAKIRVSALDIPEMALRNIGIRLPESQQGMALLYLGEQTGVILLIREKMIYLARKLGGLNDFFLPSAEDQTLSGDQDSSARPEELPERLVLEIQRSLDFFESSFRLSAISSLVVFPLPPGYEASLLPILQSGLALPCRCLDLKELFTVGEPFPEAEQERCLTAIGAFLRATEGN